MALSKVTFTRTDGNLGTALAGQDHISGLLFDTTSAPGTTSLGDVYLIFSVKDAGILNGWVCQNEDVCGRSYPSLVYE